MTDPIIPDDDTPEFAALDDNAPEDAEPVDEPAPSPKNDTANP